LYFCALFLSDLRTFFIIFPISSGPRHADCCFMLEEPPLSGRKRMFQTPALQILCLIHATVLPFSPMRSEPRVFHEQHHGLYHGQVNLTANTILLYQQ
jgi:hypothetical protein